MIVTLTSDFGHKDPYLAIFKGMIYSEESQVTIVDISHEIAPFTISEAAYTLGAAYRHYPKGTIHLILVDLEVGRDKKLLVAAYDGHYFISADNGVLSLITDGQPFQKIRAMDITEGSTSFGLFVKATAMLLQKRAIENIGNIPEKIVESSNLKPVVASGNNKIIGKIIYVDNYGNAISNITESMFRELQNGREFEIFFRNYSINKIYKSYLDFGLDSQEKEGEKLAVFNSLGYLEIALYRQSKSGGTASSLLGIEHESAIVIQFNH